MTEENRQGSRQEILARVRSQLGVRGDEPGRRGRVQARLANPSANLIPERAKKPRAELIRLFQSTLETCGSKVSRVRSLKALPDAIASALRDSNLIFRIRVGNDPIFDSLKREPGLIEIMSGPAEAEDSVSLSHAIAAAAETGTLFLASGSDNPSTLNFLPETHMVVVRADDIAGSYEENWAKIRTIYGAGKMPRTVNLI